MLKGALTWSAMSQPVLSFLSLFLPHTIDCVCNVIIASVPFLAVLCMRFSMIIILSSFSDPILILFAISKDRNGTKYAAAISAREDRLIRVSVPTPTTYRRACTQGDISLRYNFAHR